jgi:hypothetical protein
MVFLKVAPWKHVIRFGMKRKLAPRYIGPYKIIERIGTVAYRILLPPHLDRIHNVFHVSMLRKADLDPTRILPQIPMEVREDLTMEVQPVQIMDRSIKELRNKKVPLVKVLWRNSQIEEETWESESEMMMKYPGLFSYIGMNLISRTKFFLGGENVKPLGEKL